MFNFFVGFHICLGRCQEFLELMRQMRIGIDAKMAMELFQEFRNLNWEQVGVVGIRWFHMFLGVWC